MQYITQFFTWIPICKCGYVYQAGKYTKFSSFHKAMLFQWVASRQRDREDSGFTAKNVNGDDGEPRGKIEAGEIIHIYSILFILLFFYVFNLLYL